MTNTPTCQISYWEEKGYITSESAQDKNRRYNYFNIKKLLLIKELLDEGYTLEASVAKVNKRVEMIKSAFDKPKK